jgi:hypothetical protein
VPLRPDFPRATFAREVFARDPFLTAAREERRDERDFLASARSPPINNITIKIAKALTNLRRILFPSTCQLELRIEPDARVGLP